jgi:hypothetical protein
MRSILLAFVFLAAAIIPSYADVTPATAAFLKKIGVDPRSAKVTAIADDVVSNKDVQGVSLNSLAAKRDEEGIKRFIATRDFIHKYEADTNTPFPSTALYDGLYLTKPELHFVYCQLAKGFNAKDPSC